MSTRPLRRTLLWLACALCAARLAEAQFPPFEVVYEFGDEVSYPGPLIEASDGNFYGTTSVGGVYNRGTIFRMTRDYRLSILYTFSGAFDGGYPVGQLLQASDGHLYGATYRNGAYDQGILYRITLDGEFTILHAFNLAVDGRYPTGSLVQGTDGLLYGTTTGGGCCSAPIDQGMAFRSTLDGIVTVLHRFAGGMNDGWFPGPLIQAADGNLYGKTWMGGYFNLGVLFRMTPAGDVTIMHRFTEGMPSDSGNATSRTLAQGIDGNIYGNYGCFAGIFRMTLQGVFSHLTSLPGSCTYSGPPFVELLAGRDGLLYATTSGATYVVGLTGEASTLRSDHSPGFANLMQSINGHLYGAAYDYARHRAQIVRITPRAGQVTKAGATSIADAAVRVSWSPVANAASYTVKRREPGGGDIVVATGVQALSFVDASTIKGRRYTYALTATNEFGEGIASYDVSIIAGRATAGDFNGDGAADPAIFRPSTGEWYVAGAPAAVTFGGAGDVPVAADYNGDGRVDIAVFRPSTGEWHIRGIGSVAWGASGDIPVPGYYRGGDAVDLAVYRPATGTWYIRGMPAIAWGLAGDRPAPADYDGDGLTDVAVLRTSLTYNPADGWYIRYATGAGRYVGLCCGADPVPGDYDGDGQTDLGVFHAASGGWYIQPSTGGERSTLWGGGTDQVVPADYNGDGLTDIAVFRESTGEWYVLLTGSKTGSPTGWQFRFGGSGDIPVQKRP